MPFPKQLLADHEDIIFDINPHWVAVVMPALWTVVLAAIGYLAHRFTDEPTNVDNIVSIVLLVSWYFLTILPVLQWRFTNFVLTTDRLITRSGIIAKNSKEIPLERINDVTFSQSILERMLGAGDLMIESAGERGQTRITHVRKPESLQLMIYKETEKNNDRMMGRGPSPESASSPPPAREQTVTDQLEALGRLKKDGLISDAEFEQKKKQLLDRM